jgi:hypothetical protein
VIDSIREKEIEQRSLMGKGMGILEDPHAYETNCSHHQIFHFLLTVVSCTKAVFPLLQTSIGILCRIASSTAVNSTRRPLAGIKTTGRR